jgi:hypothetical protein
MCWSHPSKGTRMINELPTAFPWMHKDITCTGMTLRDYFAAKAMQAIIGREDNRFTTTLEFVGGKAYQYADAMIKARGQE